MRARGMFRLLVADGGFPSKRVWVKAQNSVNSLLSSRGLSALWWRMALWASRGMFRLLVVDGGFPSKRVWVEAQNSVNSLLSSCGLSARLLVCGSNPADLFGWRDDDEGIGFAQETSISGQFAQQWELRKTAQEAALKEMAKSELRRLLTHNHSLFRAEFAFGTKRCAINVLASKARRGGMARRHGPAARPGSDPGY